MDKEKRGKRKAAGTGPLDETATTNKAGASKRQAQEETKGAGSVSQPAASRTSQERLQPTILTWQDLADLPKQILPEETYLHLKNAQREMALALYSLWKSINSSRRSSGEKTRKRIEVE
jgi:hypothetical protein